MSENPTPAPQQKHPWRATVRTVFQLLGALAIILPVVLPALGVATTVGWGAAALAVAAAITRVMQSPALEEFLQSHKSLSWLAASAKVEEESEHSVE